MKQLLALMGSMKTMAILMMIFAVAIGYATFIENDYGTVTAKAEIYNARWFELLLALLSVNLIYNIIRFGMYKKGKFLVFLFHISFLVILVGAAITRYVGYEGTMHIREGDTVNTMLSQENYLSINVEANGKTESFKDTLLLSKYSPNSFETSVNDVHVKLIEYIPNAAYKLVEDPLGQAVLNLMITNENSPEQIQLEEGSFFEAADVVLDFNSGQSFSKEVIAISIEEGHLHMNHPMPLKYLRMDDQIGGDLNASTAQEFSTRTLYSTTETNFVLRDFMAHASKKLGSATVGSGMNNREKDALVFELSSRDKTENFTVFGMAGMLAHPVSMELGNSKVSIGFGSILLELPFSLKLEDFQLDRYPGSMSPSSYASEVVLIDKEKGVNEPFRIYMNNILEHRGFRFFQSSYDRDEKGTVLSVNHDPGTFPTYIGYFMLTVGMFLAPFMAGGRYDKLSKKALKAATSHKTLALVFVALFSLFPQTSQADEVSPIIKKVLSFDSNHANKFGKLVVQDSGGRMKPIDTLAMEVINKIYRLDTIMGLNANQVILGMMMDPESWREINMIKTSHKEIAKIIKLEEGAKVASFSQFFEYPSELGGYKLATYVDEAVRKSPGKRNKFDKAVLKVDERINIAYMVYSGSLIKIWPRPNDKTQKWYGTIDAMQNFDSKDAEGIRSIAVDYFTAVADARQSGDWSKADASLLNVEKYQNFYGLAVYPDTLKVELEIWYNHAKVFERLWPMYFLVGFVLLILSFIKILKPAFKIKWASKGTFILLIMFLLAHTLGLGIRWYISGHAPWSNGYESMIYIAWATVFAGFIFAKNSPITLASTSIMTGLILFVAHLNWMDPQVTNLVPVLNSYWLSIHVSIITASYGFLGLGALLGFLVLILFIVKTQKNEYNISLSIKELNSINEMSLMIGLALLTVGNFMGGVWANESWGRYWGWDPKETWALVTILVYAVVIHVRFIKALYSDYMYSVISLLAFTSVIMTYFGVNYYLAGMHSYAKGDPVPIPDFVPVTYAIIFGIIAVAYVKENIINQKLQKA
ncbi:MAG: cytochrome c biogenesis protein CcsA [Campylobacterota bacterium]|nr:cytochrome c biogenesis protein CcsA [Campylobacterota bacterium]